MNRVDRLMAYLLLFQSRGWRRAQDFAQEFEISERTVYRDIQALCEVGVPIVAMPGEGYRLMEGYYLPPITFSADEARSLYLAISMLTGLATAGRTQAAAMSALEKIRAVLPAAALRQVEALQAIIHFYAMPGLSLNFDDKTLLALQEAIHHRRVVHLRYHALHTNEVTERDVEPLELAFLDKTWILSAYCRLRQGQRAFRLDRIDRLTVCEEHFSPREFPLGEPRPKAKPINVVVRFDPAIVRWVKERQHFTWVEERADASATLMIYRPRSLDQIEGWLLSWGDKMEVLEPAVLRERLADMAARMQLKHQATTIGQAP
ncbi:MAG: YafY family transcriptional regulator [Chloroflexi bacterium]|nr:YafY family transcriptional regulator [Chloroflexota bacterium]